MAVWILAVFCVILGIVLWIGGLWMMAVGLWVATVLGVAVNVVFDW